MAYILKEDKQNKLSAEEIEKLISLNIMRVNKAGELVLIMSSFSQSDANYIIEKEVYKKIIDYLNEKAGTHYKSNVKATQTLINARIREGHTIDDFFAVIDSRCADWLEREEMRKYLRPITIFAPTKFEGYLQQARQSNSRPKPSERHHKQGDEVTKNYGVLLEW